MNVFSTWSINVGNSLLTTQATPCHHLYTTNLSPFNVTREAPLATKAWDDTWHLTHK
jgi:hypothetical protein